MEEEEEPEIPNEKRNAKFKGLKTKIERDLLDCVLLANKLIYFFVIVQWFNFEVWWYIGEGKFVMNLTK